MDPIYLKHQMGVYHPESPRRLEVIYGVIEENGSRMNLERITPRKANMEEIGTNHSPRYVEKIASTAGKRSTFLDPDTSTCADSWDAAAMAVGGLLNLVDAVVEEKVRNGFALVRPPGHHAEWDRAMGFCLFNNIAIAARYALAHHGMERIAIVDWDLHHGNGTQHSFYDDPRVLFISTHQFPHYPGTGSLRETGRGEGEGHTVNVPFAPGAGDREYAAVFHMIVGPLFEAYKPELVLVSAGFDAHYRDPLGAMQVSEDGYEQLTQILMHLTAELCSSRLILTLEGGYDLTALGQSVGRIVNCLASYDPDNSTVPLEPAWESLEPAALRCIRDVLNTHRGKWPNLATV